MAIKKIIPTEHQEQCAVIKYCDWNHVPIFAIPNGSSKSMNQARKFKAEGLRSGIPDLFIPVPTDTSHGLFLEMKRRKKSIISDEQKDWIHKLQTYGYTVVICKGSDEAVEAICKHCFKIKWEA